MPGLSSTKLRTRPVNNAPSGLIGHDFGVIVEGIVDINHLTALESAQYVMKVVSGVKLAG